MPVLAFHIRSRMNRRRGAPLRDTARPRRAVVAQPAEDPRHAVKAAIARPFHAEDLVVPHATRPVAARPEHFHPGAVEDLDDLVSGFPIFSAISSRIDRAT
jgi:hypothetical protein